MKKITERQMRAARALALAEGSDILHALTCEDCQLREQFLFVLAVMGWDEREFLGAYFDYLIGRL